ncbi:YciI family protein [Parasphingopyxis algicola]|uniref:YciI family protein n=1 Tax=Parasphingopyxis algicola TaxID=2026624 RepID=UPI0015A42F42|nr:YciI family protein [Parasphingopyxis algicola]QLC26086.1 YciI family protein [Parasphingopyxis algicola]
MTKVMPSAAYIAWCKDLPGDEPARLRKELAPAHFVHIETIMDKIRVAGPVRNENGETIGSMLVFNAESEAEARALLDRDPYAGAGLWESVEIHPFLPAAGEWIGGKIW